MSEKPHKPLAIEYDVPKDIVTIDGVKYHADVFRTFALPPANQVFRIQNKDGIVIIDATGLDERIPCSGCGKSVSTPVPRDTIVRAWIECPECLQAKVPEVKS